MSPRAGAVGTPAHRKRVLIAFDIVRAVLVLALPFVTAIWQVSLLIALLQTASAGFTPLFQSLIPEILPDERDYTRALSLPPLPYVFDHLLVSAVLTCLLIVFRFHGLFTGTQSGLVLFTFLFFRNSYPFPTT